MRAGPKPQKSRRSNGRSSQAAKEGVQSRTFPMRAAANVGRRRRCVGTMGCACRRSARQRSTSSGGRARPQSTTSTVEEHEVEEEDDDDDEEMSTGAAV